MTVYSSAHSYRNTNMAFFLTHKAQYTHITFCTYSVVWNHKLTVKQSDKIESPQKRAMRIIHGDQVFGMPNDSLPFLSNTEPLHQRRAMAGKTFFESVCQETSFLNNLLPDKCNPHVISKMCHPTCYPIPYNRTKQTIRHFTPSLATSTYLQTY